MKKTFPHTYFINFINLAIIFLGIWLLTTWNEWSYGRWHHFLKGIGTAVGIFGYFIFSLSLFLSSRWSKIENQFGGLDQIYRIHHRLGIWGFMMILIHPWILAIKWLPNHWGQFLSFIFPIHHRFSINIGSYALLLMGILIVITISQKLRYHQWKLSHQFMSLVFLFASLHIIFVEHKFSSSELSHMLLLIPMGIGAFGIVYKQIYLSLLKKQPTVNVTNVNYLSDRVIEITFQPKEGFFQFIPGQYAFFSFQGPGLSSEFHPFTPIKSTRENEISILMKERGDFTHTLYQTIKPGYSARIEGPYGRFDCRNAGSSQIWIGGGIGIVPFIAWIRSYNELSLFDQKIDLYYSFHNKNDAIYIDEFERATQKLAHFRYFLFCSEENNRINAQKVQSLSEGLIKKDILMCGPKSLTTALRQEFLTLGIQKKNIFFEDFDFFD